MLSLRNRIFAAWMVALVLVLAFPFAAQAEKKKKKTEEAPKKTIAKPDYSNIVWPNPPAVARVKYEDFYAAQKRSDVEKPKTSKQSWMDRLAGSVPQQDNKNVRFQLIQPYGLTTDSKGNLYIADSKVGAIFVFNPENHDLTLIKNKTDAHFDRIIGLAMDDNDRLFVSDPGLKHVLVFNPQRKAEEVITEGMSDPGGIAIDTQNRLLYVADVALDQVLVYDADSFKLKRKIGTTGKNHTLTTPGDFSKPTGVAVDKEGNVYVTDTMNDRVEIFDADGMFIRTWGKAGDGPGYFSRPKGITVDSDGHVWVADGMQDRLQVFTAEGELCISLGGHGLLPGQFQALMNVYADPKHNRVFTSEIYPGRVQQFRYVTDAEAEQEKKKREERRVAEAPKEVAPPTTAAEPK